MASAIIVNMIIKLRNYSILKLARNIPASVIFLIIELFFYEGLNASKIANKLKLQFKDTINNIKVENLLRKFRLIIFYHLKYKYNNTLIGGFNHLNRSREVAIDESLIIHNERGEQIWLLGGIETKERRVCLLLTKNRSRATYVNFFVILSAILMKHMYIRRIISE